MTLKSSTHVGRRARGIQPARAPLGAADLWPTLRMLGAMTKRRRDAGDVHSAIAICRSFEAKQVLILDLSNRVNICNPKLRSRSKGTISLEEQREATGFELAADLDDLSSNIQQEQITQHVRRALQGLPAEMRQVIIMKEYDGLKFSEIAEILGIPISTVKTRMYTGLTELRKRLEHLRQAV